MQELMYQNMCEHNIGALYQQMVGRFIDMHEFSRIIEWLFAIEIGGSGDELIVYNKCGTFEEYMSVLFVFIRWWRRWQL
jgi:hypothetical protein